MAEEFLESFFVRGNADAEDAPLRRMNLASRQRPWLETDGPKLVTPLHIFSCRESGRVQLVFLSPHTLN